MGENNKWVLTLLMLDITGYSVESFNKQPLIIWGIATEKLRNLFKITVTVLTGVGTCCQ